MNISCRNVWVVDYEIVGMACVSTCSFIWLIKLILAQEKNAGERSLLRCLFRSFWRPALSPVLPRLLKSCFTYAQPFLIQSVTEFLNSNNTEEPLYWGYGLIGAYGLVYTSLAVSLPLLRRQTISNNLLQITNGWYRHKQYRLITMIRGGLVSMIYTKTLSAERTSIPESEATSLMSADIERICASLGDLQELWAALIELAVGLWLLYRQVDLAMLTVAGLSLGLFGLILASQ